MNCHAIDEQLYFQQSPHFCLIQISNMNYSMSHNYESHLLNNPDTFLELMINPIIRKFVNYEYLKCVCVCVCVCMCMCVCVCVSVCLSLSVCFSLSFCLPAFLSAYLPVFISCVYVYVCICLCLFVFVCVWCCVVWCGVHSATFIAFLLISRCVNLVEVGIVLHFPI